MRTFFDSYDELLKMCRIVLFILFFSISIAQSEPLTLKQTCLKSLGAFKSFFKEEAIDQVCGQVEVNESCKSSEGVPIFHFDKPSKLPNAKKILVMSLIHGDETHAGNVGRFWMERLAKVDARNSWRVIPVTNPDGVKNKTRVNGRGVDLNRNFPTKDWDAQAIKYWENEAKKSSRKYPGAIAGAEPEVKCVMNQIEDYKPDFVISIHTPLNVLDFDGPQLKRLPPYSYLPWKSLGNFPGSLGRYLWAERKTPVLTTELKDGLPTTSLPFEQLQDVIGTLVKTDLK